MPKPGDEDRLWARVRAGDHQAFEVLFDRHADFLYNVAFRRTGSWETAEDIVAKVFLEAWRQRDRVRTHEGSLRPWLIGVALNQVLRHWREAGRAQRAYLRLASAQPHHGDHAADVADRLDAERQMAAILAALGDLPPAHREILQLWAWEELSYEEIAQALEIPVGTVRSRLHRARARLESANGTHPRSRESSSDTRPGAASNRERVRKEGRDES